VAVPTRVEACRLLLSLAPKPRLVAHCAAVAEVAAFLAARIARQGQQIDRRLVEAAALLHDLDKALPAAQRPRGDHGRAGAEWLHGHGFAELSSAVRDHPVTRLTDEDVYPRWWREASIEDRVVAYADKRALQRLVPMDARFAEWARRYRTDPDGRQALGRERADTLEAQVCAAAGVRPAQVRRLRWVGRAMAEASR
jgi:putative nucleotidyltransferase with HDIG domain